MHIATGKNTNGATYLRLAESFRDGKRMRSRTLKYLGPLARFDDGQPHYLERLRESFKQGAPLIAELEPFCSGLKSPVSLTLHPDNDVEAHSNPRVLGSVLLEGIFESLGLHDVCFLAKTRSKIKYDLAGILRTLTLGRVLKPASKKATLSGAGCYQFPLSKSPIAEKDMYRALDILAKHTDSFVRRINTKIDKRVGSAKGCLYYDVTNYYFEIFDNDLDTTDAFGLRKRGVSKEKRQSPLVQMGLFIDERGFPRDFGLFPGNSLDQTTLRPLLAKEEVTRGFERTIVVADRGLRSYKNAIAIAESGNGYVFSASVIGSNADTKKWMMDSRDWVGDENFRSKSRIVVRREKNEAEKFVEVRERQVVYFSAKQYHRALKEKAKFIEFVQKFRADPASYRASKKTWDKYMIEHSVDVNTGEVTKNKKVFELNEKKIATEAALLGCYLLTTSETESTDGEIIEIYHGLSRIEDAFRVLKGNLGGRPVFVWKPEHIAAHFLICYIALAMMRLIQYQVLNHQGKKTGPNGWTQGIVPKMIQDALSTFCSDELAGGYFRTTKPSTELEEIFDAFKIKCSLSIPTLSELRKFRLTVLKATK